MTKHANERMNERNIVVDMDRVMRRVELMAQRNDVYAYIKKDNVGIAMIKNGGQWIVKSKFHVNTKNAKMNGGFNAAKDQARKRGQQLIVIV